MVGAKIGMREVLPIRDVVADDDGSAELAGGEDGVEVEVGEGEEAAVGEEG